MAYSAYQPYDKQSDDNLQLFAQLQLFLTLLGGMMLKVNRSMLSSSSVAEEEGSESQSEIMGIVLILCNVSVLVSGAFVALYDVIMLFGPSRLRKWRGSSKEKKVVPQNSILAALAKANVEAQSDVVAPDGSEVGED